MKLLTMVMMSLLSLSAMAKHADKATGQEKILLCGQILIALEDNNDSEEMNLDSCMKNKTIVSTLIKNDVRKVSGIIQLSASEQYCSLTYEVEAVRENILSDLECIEQ